MSIDKEAKSPQVGINTSVNSIGLPKSKVTNLLAPMRDREQQLTQNTMYQLTKRHTLKQSGTFILKYEINSLNYKQEEMLIILIQKLSKTSIYISLNPKI